MFVGEVGALRKIKNGRERERKKERDLASFSLMLRLRLLAAPSTLSCSLRSTSHIISVLHTVYTETRFVLWTGYWVVLD
jgi:hypothetical protein